MILWVSGKIASGKSEVLKVFEEEGFFCIDADKIVHEFYEPGGLGALKVLELFGEEFLDEEGAVNRTKLRDLVFFDTEALGRLNESIHPLVFDEIQKRLPKEGDIAIEAAFLSENLFEKIFQVCLNTFFIMSSILIFYL